MRRRSVLLAGAAVALVVSGCAQPPRAANPAGAGAGGTWSGRLALRVDGEQPQTFSALFDLRGTAQAGELSLTTPIGSTLAVLQWSPGEALLKNGGQTRRYGSVDALVEAATGAAIPVDALFGWLAGRDDPVPGWKADLSQFNNGRLQATRNTPAPTADLRIIFERP